MVAEDPAAGWLPSTGTRRGVRHRRGGPRRHRVPCRRCRVRRLRLAAGQGDRARARPGRRRPTRSPGRCARRRCRVFARTSRRWRRSCSSPTSSPRRRRPPTSTNTPTPWRIDRWPAVVSRCCSVRCSPWSSTTGRPIRSSGSPRRAGATCARRASASSGPTSRPATSTTSSSSCTGVTERRSIWAHGRHPTDDGSLSPDDRVRVDVRLLDRTSGRQVVEVDGVRSAVDVRIEPSGSALPSVVEARSPTGARTFERAPAFVVHVGRRRRWRADFAAARNGDRRPCRGRRLGRGRPVADGRRGDEDGAQDHRAVCRRW